MAYNCVCKLRSQRPTGLIRHPPVIKVRTLSTYFVGHIQRLFSAARFLWFFAQLMLQLFGLLHRGYQFRHRTSDWLQRLHFSVPETSIIRTLTISLKTVGKLSDVRCQDIHGASLYAPLALKHAYEVYFGI